MLMSSHNDIIPLGQLKLIASYSVLVQGNYLYIERATNSLTYTALWLFKNNEPESNADKGNCLNILLC